MARIDKYDGVSGGYRSRLAFTPDAGDVGDVISVELNGDGNVIKATSADACRGVICLSSLLAQGDRVDVMTAGEIVGVEGLAAGTDYAAAAGGALAAGTGVGWTVEATRLVVRLAVAGAGGV